MKRNEVILTSIILLLIAWMINPIIFLFVLILIAIFVHRYGDYIERNEMNHKYDNENFRIKKRYSIDYTGKSISAFYFMENRYNVTTWKELLVEIVKIMYDLHEKEFDKIYFLPGRRRQYVTHFPEKLNVAEKINGPGIYIETKLSANNIVGLCYDIIQKFGYSENDLEIEVY